MSGSPFSDPDQVRAEAERILSMTIPAQGGRQFVETASQFDQCLAFLARLSENPAWGWLYCAACQGDPEALDLHVCGRRPFA